MASEMFVFDEFSGSNFYPEPFTTLSDSSIDSFLQEISDDQNNNTDNNNNNNNNNNSRVCDSQSLDQIAHALFSDSPPSNQLETLSIEGQFGNLTHHLTNPATALGNVYGENNSYCGSGAFPEVKTEEFHLGFDYHHQQQQQQHNSYFINCGETMLKFMQRSYSSNCFDGNSNKQLGFLPQPQPRFDTLIEAHSFDQISDGSQQIRRACSTGDLPTVGTNTQACTQQTISTSSPISGEGSNYNEETNYKVGRYTAEERKERIDRYRAKRTLRNFNKTIKYACRKTLADNRPRIRGRFARNDETEEIPKPTSCFSRFNDHDDLWADNLQEEEDERIFGSERRGRFLNNFGATTQFHYCAYN